METSPNSPVAQAASDSGEGYIYFGNRPMFDEQLGDILNQKVDKFYKLYRQADGYFGRLFRVYNAYHGFSTSGTGGTSHHVNRSGGDGEMATIMTNHIRNLGQHLLTLCTSQKPAPQPIATNTDYKSYAQNVLALGLLDHYDREKRVARITKRATELAIVLGEGYVETLWNASLGEEVQDDGSGGVVREGDLEFHVLNTLDVVRDINKSSSFDDDWIITRKFVNRYDLAAKYPEMVDHIMEAERKGMNHPRFGFTSWIAIPDSDEIPIYSFYHRKSESVPDGRMTVFIQGGYILNDGNLGYRAIPVRKIVPSEQIGMPYGYTPVFDLMALQEAHDALSTIILSNQTTFGTQNIVADEGNNISYEALAEGLNLIIKAPGTELQALELCKTPQEIFTFLNMIEHGMEIISGVNSTVRGNPEASLKSGSALALVQAQAIQFSSGLQESYAELLEDVYTDIITTLSDYADTKRVITIVGKYNQHLLKEFSGDDLKNVKRVVVDVGSSLSKTLSGRLQIAQDLMQNGLIKTPEEYLSIINTGRLEPLTERLTRTLMNIRAENELMASGKPAIAIAIDQHRMHIEEHMSLLDTPEARQDPMLVNLVMGHIMQHVQLLQTTDPNLLALIGEQSIAMPMMGAMPPGPPQQKGSAPGPKNAGPGGPPQLPKGPQQQPGQPNVSPPSLPKNPATGQQWNPQDGGGAIQPS
jgi:hypothetical protein